MRRTTLSAFALVAFLALAGPSPAFSQWAVIDVGNLVQVSRIVNTTIKHLEQAVAIRETLRRAAQPLGSMAAYRTPPLVAVRHDAARYAHGRAILTGFNEGDVDGAGYTASVRRLPPAGGGRDADVGARARVAVADAVNRRAIHTVGAGQVFGRDVARALAALEVDILNPAEALHGQAASLDKLNGAALLHARQTDGVNQQLAAMVEQLVVRSTREREAEVASLNRRLVHLEHGPAATRALLRGSSTALRNWSQP